MVKTHMSIGILTPSFGHDQSLTSFRKLLIGFDPLWMEVIINLVLMTSSGRRTIFVKMFADSVRIIEYFRFGEWIKSRKYGYGIHRKGESNPVNHASSVIERKL